MPMLQNRQVPPAVIRHRLRMNGILALAATVPLSLGPQRGDRAILSGCYAVARLLSRHSAQALQHRPARRAENMWWNVFPPIPDPMTAWRTP